MNINRLAAGHARSTGCARDHLNDANHAMGWQLQSSQNLHAKGLQGIAHEKCGGLVIGHMNRGLAAPQGIVIHAWHVVVDQGKGMDALQGGSNIQGRLAEWVGARRLGRSHREKAPCTFSTIENAVAHGAPESIQGRVAEFRLEPKTRTKLHLQSMLNRLTPEER
jgi:hypothetical protein